MNKLLQILALVALATPAAWGQDTGAGGNPEVTLHTSRGDIRLELFADKAPLSVENFLQYARDGHYDGTIFHRVISHFMIQGGGFTPNLQQKPTREPVKNEADNGLSNQRGTVAMARTNDPHSGTSQFFINVEVNTGLDHKGTESSRDWGYAVFGRVIDGMDVVDDIRFAQTSTHPTPGGIPLSDVPSEPIVIESVEIH